MAILNKNVVRSSKPISLILGLAMFLMLLNMVKSEEDSLTFSFGEFTGDEEDLILQGDATISEKVLQLTKLDDSGKPEGSSVGRALYIAPLHLWETPESVSSFETNFTFKISSPGPTPGDGLAFFIAPSNTTIPPNSGGKYLGIFPGPVLQNYPVVAVEFDTYPNIDIEDPNNTHIGFDFNNITSNATTYWLWRDGEIASAHIKYDSVSKRLSLIATYPRRATTPITLDYHVDLSTLLPQWVRVGFSATTGQHVQANTILNWSFSSTLQLANQFQNNKKDMHLASIV